MKIRQDFVTNSSSSSYICVAKVQDNTELRQYMKEEYGNFGIRLLDEYITSGKDIKDSDYDYDEFKEFCKENGIDIQDDSLYIQANFIAWSTEGDTEGDDAFLYNHIPAQYKDVVYEGEGD